MDIKAKEIIARFLEEEYPNFTKKESWYLTRRIYKACRIYALIISRNNLDVVIDCKIHYLILKFKADKELIHKIFNKESRVKYLLHKNIYDIDSKLKEKRDILKQYQICEEHKGSSTYRCPKCGKRNHTEVQVMTRSSDEATSIKCQCLECWSVFWH